MADTKITALTALTGADPANDVIPIVDVSDTTMAASGTTKKISVNNILGASGTATLASATITGDLTVDTNVLKVDSAGNRVSVNTTTFATDSAFAVKTTSGKFDVRAYGGASVKINSDAAMGYNVATGNGHIFQIADADQMTLNSNGLGVGGSPSYKLSSIGTTNNQVVLHVGNTAGTVDGDTTNVVRFAAGSGANALWANARYDGFSHAWRCNSTTTEAMVLNSSGNVGIGVTPSAWATSASRKAIQLSTAGSISAQDTGTAPYTFVASNWVSTATGDQYILGSAAPATLYRQFNGTHSWFNAPSGTGALTFTQAMTLDASGTLLVGTTSAGASGFRCYLSTDSGTTKWSVGPYVSATNFAIVASGSAGGVYLNGTTATSWTALSDERFKDIIEPISNAVAKVGSLRAVIGKIKGDETNTRKSFLIAQDIQAVLPEAVDASNPDRLGLAYTDVIPLLVAAIKELTARVQTLETR